MKASLPNNSVEYFSMLSQTTTRAEEIFRKTALPPDKRNHVAPGDPANQVMKHN